MLHSQHLAFLILVAPNRASTQLVYFPEGNTVNPCATGPFCFETSMIKSNPLRLPTRCNSFQLHEYKPNVLTSIALTETATPMRNNLTTRLTFFLLQNSPHSPDTMIIICRLVPNPCKKANILYWAHFSTPMPQKQSFTPTQELLQHAI